MSSAAALGLRKTPARACETGKSAPAAVAAPLKIGTLDSWRMGNANRPKATRERAEGNGGNGEQGTGTAAAVAVSDPIPPLRLCGFASLREPLAVGRYRAVVRFPIPAFFGRGRCRAVVRFPVPESRFPPLLAVVRFPNPESRFPLLSCRKCVFCRTTYVIFAPKTAVLDPPKGQKRPWRYRQRG